MTFQQDHFDGSAAFALQQDLFDPRDLASTGRGEADDPGLRHSIGREGPAAQV